MCQHVPGCASRGSARGFQDARVPLNMDPGIGLLLNAGACAGTWQTFHANPYRTNGILHVPDACLSRFSRLLKKNCHDLHVPAMCQERISQTAMKPMVFLHFRPGMCQHMPAHAPGRRAAAEKCSGMCQHVITWQCAPGHVVTWHVCHMNGSGQLKPLWAWAAARSLDHFLQYPLQILNKS